MSRQKSDRNFDDLVGHFRKNIYDSPKGQIRLEILWQDLLESIPALQAGRPLRILDAGAGLGIMAARLAELGHELVLCDISAEMLHEAESHIRQHHPRASYRLINSAVQELSQHTSEQFDLVIFHAVLEWLAEPRQALMQLLDFVKPGAFLSLMFYNRHGLVYRHLLNANFAVLRDNQPRTGERLVPMTPLVPDDVEGWLKESGVELVLRSGVRVIFDYLHHEQKQKLDMNQLLEMERRYSRLQPYAELARYMHFVCMKTDCT